MEIRNVSRRGLLRYAGLASGVAVLAACGGAAPTNTPGDEWSPGLFF